jgi:hypothetical protein
MIRIDGYFFSSFMAHFMVGQQYLCGSMATTVENPVEVTVYDNRNVRIYILDVSLVLDQRFTKGRLNVYFPTTTTFAP